MNKRHKGVHIRCREATRLLGEGQERKLRFRERIALKLHLLFCDPCKRFKGQLAVFKKTLNQVQDRLAEHGAELNEDHKENLKQKINQLYSKRN